MDVGRQVRWVYTPDIKEKESWQGVEMKYARFAETGQTSGEVESRLCS